MNLREFHQLSDSEFSFLNKNGFVKRSHGSDTAYIVYERGDMAIELKWEDFGYFITACIIREELEPDAGRISVNGLIRVTSPQIYRAEARGPAELFGHDALMRYYAAGLGLGLERLIHDTEAIWKQCRLVDEKVAEAEVFLADDPDYKSDADE